MMRTVLGDEVTGVAGEHEVRHFLLRSFGHLDRFPDVGKMIGNPVARDLAGSLGLGEDIREIVPLGVAEEVLNVAGEPVFDPSIRLLGMSLEGAGKCVDEFRVHAE